MVRVRFEDRDYEVAVRDGYFLIVFWNVEDPDEWPQVVGHRVKGNWREPAG